MAFEIRISEQARGRMAQWPRARLDLLAHRLKELAELIELRPVIRRDEGPVRFQLQLEQFRVGYEVDRRNERLTVISLEPFHLPSR